MVHLQGPFKHGVPTPQMEEYNAAISAVRSSVEWLLGMWLIFLSSMTSKKNLKLFLNCVGKLYLVSGILRNAVTTCLYGNLTSTYFDLPPPRLDDYFA